MKTLSGALHSFCLQQLENECYIFIQILEVREHGVAYYQFSKDESERKSQMETLNQLREQVSEIFDINKFIT